MTIAFDNRHHIYLQNKSVDKEIYVLYNPSEELQWIMVLKNAVIYPFQLEFEYFIKFKVLK